MLCAAEKAVAVLDAAVLPGAVPPKINRSLTIGLDFIQAGQMLSSRRSDHYGGPDESYSVGGWRVSEIAALQDLVAPSMQSDFFFLVGEGALANGFWIEALL